MPTQLSNFEWVQREHERRMRELAKLYAPRNPMVQLADEYRFTDANPDPPLLHFAFPVDDAVLYKYAEKHNLNHYYPCAPNRVAMTTLLFATQHLSREVQYDLEFGFPLDITADCQLILGLYTNFTIEDKMLIEEDEEDAIQMVQEALGFDKSVRPKWYFDTDDPWVPDEL